MQQRSPPDHARLNLPPQPTGRQHVPMPPGECKVTYVADCLVAPLRPTVDAAVRAAAAAAAQEVKRSGVGKHFLVSVGGAAGVDR